MYTPIENPELFGYAETESQLLRMIQQKKLPHALLFSGAEGIGKATLAYRLARYLLTDAQPPEPVMGLFGAEPVEETLRTSMDQPAIRRMLAGSHGDLLVIQPVADDKRKTSADTIFIEQVRQVTEFMHHTPSESAWRVVIIDPAEAMNINAANALLKMLEEPPAQALLILVTHQAGRLLPTIRSRCRKITLRTPSEAASAEIFAQQNQPIPAAELRQLLMLTQGSSGKALRYAAHHALAMYKEVLEVLAAPTPKAASSFAARAAKAGAEKWPITTALFLQAVYRLCMQATEGNAFVPLDDEEHAAFATMLHRQPLAAWLALWERAEMMLPQAGSLTLDKTQILLHLLHLAEGEASTPPLRGSRRE